MSHQKQIILSLKVLEKIESGHDDDQDQLIELDQVVIFSIVWSMIKKMVNQIHLCGAKTTMGLGASSLNGKIIERGIIKDKFEEF